MKIGNNFFFWIIVLLIGGCVNFCMEPFQNAPDGEIDRASEETRMTDEEYDKMIDRTVEEYHQDRERENPHYRRWSKP